MFLRLALLLLLAPAAHAQWTDIGATLGLSGSLSVRNVATDGDVHVVAVGVDPFNANRFALLRSLDGGATWAETFSGFDATADAPFLGDLDGQFVALVATDEETTHVLRSSDQGATWAATPTPAPGGGAWAARIGTTYVLSGADGTHRSTDDGATWTTLTSTIHRDLVVFGGQVYGRTASGGYIERLDGDAWTRLTDPNLRFLQSLWAADGRLWAKRTRDAAPYASSDGTTWATASATGAWLVATPGAGGTSPWMLHTSSLPPLLVTTDEAATTTDVTAGYPLNGVGDQICPGTFSITPTEVLARVNCGVFDMRLYRYDLGGITATTGAPDAPALRVSVAPHPMRDAATVRLSGLAPGISARVTLLDALGREVARLHDGPLAGDPLALPTGLAPGVYVVRVRTSDGHAASRRLVVAR